MIYKTLKNYARATNFKDRVHSKALSEAHTWPNSRWF